MRATAMQLILLLALIVHAAVCLTDPRTQQDVISNVSPLVWDFWKYSEQTAESELAAANPDAIETPRFCPDERQFLGLLNDLRSKHGVRPVSWNAPLATQALQHLHEDETVCGGLSAYPDATTTFSNATSSSIYGMGYRALGPLAVFKCVPAVSDWYLGGGSNKVDDSPDIARSTALVAASTYSKAMLWKGTTDVGCAMKFCSNTHFVVYCFFGPQEGTFTAAETKDNILPAQGTCPQVIRTTHGDNPDTLSKKYNRLPENIFCYSEQMNVQNIGQGGIPVVIPCADAFEGKGVSCPGWDLAATLAEGHCPTSYTVMPGDTWESIADMINKFITLRQASNLTWLQDGSSVSQNITREDLLCYNPGYVNDPNPLQGMMSTIILPCPDEDFKSKCKQMEMSYPNGATSCTNPESLEALLNALRARYDLSPVKWDEAWAEALKDLYNQSPLEMCTSEDAWTAFTFGNPNVTTLFARTPAPIASTSCNSVILDGYSAAISLPFLPQYTVEVNSELASYYQSATALVSPSLRRIACVAGTCGPYLSMQYCFMDVTAEELAIEAAADNLEPAVPDQCPFVYYPEAGESLESVAIKYNSTVDRLVCWNNQMPPPELEHFPLRMAWGLPVVIPCKDDVIDEDCLVLQVTAGECGVEHSVQPSETIQEVAQRYNVSVPQLCCVGGYQGSCEARPGDLLNITCPDESMDSQYNCTIVDACGIPYAIERDAPLQAAIPYLGYASERDVCCYNGAEEDCDPWDIPNIRIPCMDEMETIVCSNKTAALSSGSQF